MSLEDKTKKESIRMLVAVFDACYDHAKQDRYIVTGKTYKGLRMVHRLDKKRWATITETDPTEQSSEGKSWELTYYDYFPEDEEPFSPRK